MNSLPPVPNKLSYSTPAGHLPIPTNVSLKRASIGPVSMREAHSPRSPKQEIAPLQTGDSNELSSSEESVDDAELVEAFNKKTPVAKELEREVLKRINFLFCEAGLSRAPTAEPNLKLARSALCKLVPLNQLGWRLVALDMLILVLERQFFNMTEETAFDLVEDADRFSEIITTTFNKQNLNVAVKMAKAFGLFVELIERQQKALHIPAITNETKLKLYSAQKLINNSDLKKTRDLNLKYNAAFAREAIVRTQDNVDLLEDAAIRFYHLLQVAPNAYGEDTSSAFQNLEKTVKDLEKRIRRNWYRGAFQMRSLAIEALKDSTKVLELQKYISDRIVKAGWKFAFAAIDILAALAAQKDFPNLDSYPLKEGLLTGVGNVLLTIDNKGLITSDHVPIQGDIPHQNDEKSTTHKVSTHWYKKVVNALAVKKHSKKQTDENTSPTGTEARLVHAKLSGLKDFATMNVDSWFRRKAKRGTSEKTKEKPELTKLSENTKFVRRHALEALILLNLNATDPKITATAQRILHGRLYGELQDGILVPGSKELDPDLQKLLKEWELIRDDKLLKRTPSIPGVSSFVDFATRYNPSQRAKNQIQEVAVERSAKQALKEKLKRESLPVALPSRDSGSKIASSFDQYQQTPFSVLPDGTAFRVSIEEFCTRATPAQTPATGTPRDRSSSNADQDNESAKLLEEARKRLALKTAFQKSSDDFSKAEQGRKLPYSESTPIPRVLEDD